MGGTLPVVVDPDDPERVVWGSDACTGLSTPNYVSVASFVILGVLAVAGGLLMLWFWWSARSRPT